MTDDRTRTEEAAEPSAERPDPRQARIGSEGPAAHAASDIRKRAAAKREVGRAAVPEEGGTFDVAKHACYHVAGAVRPLLGQHADSADIADAAVAALEKAGLLAPVAVPAPSCETCGDTGYHTFDPPVGAHEANQTEPCPDCDVQSDPSRFTYTEEDLERAAQALYDDHGNPPISEVPEDEREAMWANLRTDAEIVLKAVGGEWVES